MEVKEINFEINIDGINIIAKCQKFQVHKVPQYHVALFPHKLHSLPFNFYEKEKGKLYWLPMFGKREAMAKYVASVLEKQLGRFETSDV